MNSTLKSLSIACMMSLVACNPATESRSVEGSNESPGTSTAPVSNAEPATPAPVPADSADSTKPPGATDEQPGSKPIPEPSKPAPVPVDANTLTYNGMGKIRYGMTKDEFLALNLRAHDPSEVMDGPDSCHFHPLAPAGDTHVMIEKKRVTRIDAGKGIKNSLGISVGDPIAPFLAKHPGAVVTPHKYVTGAKEVMLWNGGHRSAFVIETNAKETIERIRSGIPPNVEYVEGCS